MNRTEHLAWAKHRALEYVDAGDPMTGWTSLVSDLRKHEALVDHSGIELGALLLLSGHMTTPAAVRELIEGMN